MKTPNRSKCLRTLRKVFPGAEVKETQGVLVLSYMHPSGERVQVLEASPAKGSVKPTPGALLFSVVRLAFRQLGYETKFKSAGLPFEFSPVEGFERPESNLPIELDPAIPPEEVAAILNAQIKERTEAQARADAYSALMPPGLQSDREAAVSTELKIPITPEDVPPTRKEEKK